MLVYDKLTNKLRPSKDIQFVDKLIGLRALGKHWEVIDEIVSHWQSKNPKKYRSFIIEMDQKRGTRANKYGSNKNKSVRSLVDIPEDIYYLIRKVYTADEMTFDKDFVSGMYKRYPFMRASEQL